MPLCAAKLAEFNDVFSKATNFSRFTVASLRRLLISDLLSGETTKAINLDSDTIVNLDIRELWRIELDDKPFGVVTELQNGYKSKFAMCRDGFVNDEDYFNAGVLLINLQAMKARYPEIRSATEFVANNPQYNLCEQDVLNYCFSKQTLKLPIRFNSFVRERRALGEMKVESCIYHYLDHQTALNMNDPFNRLFMKYFIKTPWLNEDAIGHLYEGTRQIYIEQKNFATQISSIVSGKTRGFLIASPNTEIIKRIFYVKADEEYITATSPDSLQKMIQSLRDANGKKIFFILAQEHPLVRQVLMQEGFAEGRDFLNAIMFLSDAHGVPLNSYLPVKLL